MINLAENSHFEENIRNFEKNLKDFEKNSRLLKKNSMLRSRSDSVRLHKSVKKMPGITLRFDEYDGLFCYRLLQANAPHSSRQSCLRDPRVSVVTVPRADPKGPRVVGEAGGPSKSP